MPSRTVFALGGVLVGALVASQWKDIVRYVKIERMSFGDGNPGAVPAIGRHCYPDRSAGSAPHAEADFGLAQAVAS
jgi:hypothetical protein